MALETIWNFTEFTWLPIPILLCIRQDFVLYNKVYILCILRKITLRFKKLSFFAHVFIFSAFSQSYCIQEFFFCILLRKNMIIIEAEIRTVFNWTFYFSLNELFPSSFFPLPRSRGLQDLLCNYPSRYEGVYILLCTLSFIYIFHFLCLYILCHCISCFHKLLMSSELLLRKSQKNVHYLLILPWESCT